MTATVGSEAGPAGDEVARLYHEYAPKLRRFCLGRLRSAEDADDAVQTVFLRVYTALRGGTAPVYEAAWLYKIAHNVCLSRLESGAARARVEQPRDLDELQDVLAAPGDRRDELVGLADALAAMPANLRQAILLREWQGLSYAEIAEALGVSVSAVETLIFRARRHLAAALESGVGTARSAAALLQLPWLLRRLRSLLASGRGAQLGIAKVSAVAVLAAGGVGAGVATSVLGAPTHATTTVAPHVVAGRAPVLPAASVHRIATRARPLVAHRRPTHRQAAVPAQAPRPVAVAAVRFSAATTTTTVQSPPVVPAAAPRGPVPAPAVPTLASTPATTVPASTTTTASPVTTTVAAPPTTTVPALPTSTVAAPAVTVPAAVPTVSVPVLPVPTPTVSAPAIAVPAVPALTVTTPVATATTPGVTVPLPALP